MPPAIVSLRLVASSPHAEGSGQGVGARVQSLSACDRVVQGSGRLEILCLLSRSRGSCLKTVGYGLCLILCLEYRCRVPHAATWRFTRWLDAWSWLPKALRSPPQTTYKPPSCMGLVLHSGGFSILSSGTLAAEGVLQYWDLDSWKGLERGLKCGILLGRSAPEGGLRPPSLNRASGKMIAPCCRKHIFGGLIAELQENPLYTCNI